MYNTKNALLTSSQFIHDPLLTWRLTSAASPAGPNFTSEREEALAGPQANRGRRASILDADPAALRAAQAAVSSSNDPMGGLAGPMGPMGPMAGGPPGVRSRARTNSSAGIPGSLDMNGGANGVGGQQNQDPTEIQNARALEVLDRVSQKLTGRDFKQGEELPVLEQVDKLIVEATKLENLCQHYIGWCSFW